MGTIWLHHVIRLCGHKFITNGMMAYSFQTMLLLPPSWMVLIVLRGLSQITRYYQTGCRILEYQMNWSGLGLWLSDPYTSQIIGPHSKWGCTKCRHNLLLMLRIYPLVHWWLIHMNCGILSHHTVSLPLITASSSCHNNRCLPYCLSNTSQ